MARAVDLKALRSLTPQAAGQSLYRARKQLDVHLHEGPIGTLRTDTHRGRDTSSERPTTSELIANACRASSSSATTVACTKDKTEAVRRRCAITSEADLPDALGLNIGMPSQARSQRTA